LPVHDRGPDLPSRLVLELADDRLPGNERLDDSDALAFVVLDRRGEHGRGPELSREERSSDVSGTVAGGLEAAAELEVDLAGPDVGAHEAADALEVDAAQSEERAGDLEGASKDVGTGRFAEGVLVGEVLAEADRIGRLGQLLLRA